MPNDSSNTDPKLKSSAEAPTPPPPAPPVNSPEPQTEPTSTEQSSRPELPFASPDPTEPVTNVVEEITSPAPEEAVILPTDPPSGSNNSSKPGLPKKVILLAAAIFVLMGGIATSVYLVQRQQQISTSAWDCEKYTFSISPTGDVSVSNDSTRNEVSQKASVFINDQSVGILDVPALSAGTSANIGRVPVPTTGIFTWRITGEKDCRNEGTIKLPTPTTKPTDTPTPSKPQTSPTKPPTSPTKTPIPTKTPVPTKTPAPTKTPVPTKIPTPSPTLPPGVTPTVTPVQPTSTPGPTATSTPSNSTNSCGGSCGTNYNCDSGLFCYQGFCRNPSCQTDSDCNCGETASAPTPTPVTQLAESGYTTPTLFITLSSAVLLTLGLLLAL